MTADGAPQPGFTVEVDRGEALDLAGAIRLEAELGLSDTVDVSSLILIYCPSAVWQRLPGNQG